MKVFRLKGQVAIVTGAGQGIGKAIAIALAKEGARVVLADITGKEQDTAMEIGRLGGEVIPVRLDVSRFLEAKEVVNGVAEKFGRIDILVNNAGIYPFKSFDEMDESDWDRVINTNLKGVFNCTKAVIPYMKRQRYGKIVNISSVAGTVVGFPGLSHYSASKAGIVGFTRSLALEVAKDGICVNAVAPGPIETEGTRSIERETYEGLRRMIPMGRFGKPEEITSLVVFLASETSSFITGQVIVADGGYTIL
ncbi:MAG: SDR family NAD(P)-dependent oxidoreductase [Candidatus Methanomethylicaceae archaeon]